MHSGETLIFVVFRARHGLVRTSLAGCPVRSPPVGPQAVDEIGEPDLPRPPKPLCGNDGLNLRDAVLDVAVDDYVIVFRPVAHFLGRLRHPGSDDGCAVLGACPEPRLECGEAGRQDEDGDKIIADGRGQLLRALPVEVADDITPGGER